MADTRIPRLAIMGHPNAGKSSVVATLTENDCVAIDKRAGTTTESDVYPVVIDGRTVIEFIDTPGFQNPNAILEWFQANENERDLARIFVDRHRDNPLFAHDCALLEPVADGAGIILVVDGSKRIKEKDRVEIELLRLTARPRMAILNNLSNQTRHMEQWQDALSKAFNSVRTFNAHRATYAERIKLLHALKSIDQRWEQRVEDAIDAFAHDWERRTDQSVATILDLLKEALSYQVSKVVKDKHIIFQSGRERVKAEIVAEFEDGLRRLERAAQEQIRATFQASRLERGVRFHPWSGSVIGRCQSGARSVPASACTGRHGRRGGIRRLDRSGHRWSFAGCRRIDRRSDRRGARRESAARRWRS
jgi:GTPase Era involved in 16S rRNA processing